MTIPSVLPRIRTLLLADPAVSARTEDRIFVGRPPATLVSQMPISAVSISGLGGPAEMYLPLHRWRVQVVCYGGRKTAYDTDVDAHYLALEVYEALHQRQAFVEGNVKFGSILLVSGPTQMRDPDLKDAPAELLIFSVYACTVPVVRGIAVTEAAGFGDALLVQS